ncbi:hypothetical protein CFP71_40675 [Amycolatopsis thailandensis]|uniref:Uncharacterized protein n=1 Tax=Amycolatopsis thailandensis TaxID=589330 RepID=A0A229RCU7_9PSEU|nr:hypothetical protein [Amycolatopsis thailandensis]OXM44271.1 hypothetical protein CFP71_40675 [Amycolatopsis thailandensis]
MTDSVPPAAPLLVLVRDKESGWAHVARQPHDPRATPRFTGFLHTSTHDELITTMRTAGYSVFATYAIDPGTTNYWFAPTSSPPRPGVPGTAARRPATMAAAAA